jgi:diphthamide biosynthesis protein 3
MTNQPNLPKVARSKINSSKIFFFSSTPETKLLHRDTIANLLNMAENIYDEIEIEDMTYDPTLEIYHYPCPCGDRFQIGIADLRDGEDVAVCPSCSLMIRVIFEVVSGISFRPIPCSGIPEDALGLSV